MSFFLSPFPYPSEKIKKPKNNVLGLQCRPLNGLSPGCMFLCNYPEHGRGTGFLGNNLPRSPVSSVWDLQNHCLILWEAGPGPWLSSWSWAPRPPEGKDSTQCSLAAHRPPACFYRERHAFTLCGILHLLLMSQ